MGLKQFLKKYYEYDKEDIKDEKLNVDDYKIFKILDNAVEGNIDFDKFSVLHRDVGEYFDVGLNNLFTLFQLKILMI